MHPLRFRNASNAEIIKIHKIINSKDTESSRVEGMGYFYASIFKKYIDIYLQNDNVAECGQGQKRLKEV